MVVPRGLVICQKSHSDFILTPTISHAINNESRHCPKEIIRDRLWVGGIAAAINETVLRATGVNHVVLLRNTRGKLVKKRFEKFLTYSEHVIDESNCMASILGTVRCIMTRLERGERVIVHETVLSYISKIICGIVLRVLRPELSLENVESVLLYSQAFGHVISNGDTFNLASVDAERRRLASLARLWTAKAAKLPRWPGVDVVHTIAASIDPMFRPGIGSSS